MRNCYALSCLISKRALTLFAFVMVSLFAKAQFPLPYCAETFPTSIEPITKVVFNTISNTTSATVGMANNPAHEDFTAISTSVLLGSTYSMQVQGNTDGNWTTYVRVFVDWNNDNDFLDLGESFDIGTIANSTGTDGITATANILVPPTATPGNYKDACFQIICRVSLAL
jgi:hypothetical protein